ncbi:MAG TPA: hypothetical protein VEJ18_00965, partial [Planctomycetota bacterium]|nr:hypothetical protein [Planctomycetota bacterium]
LAVRATALFTSAFKVDVFKLRMETLASLGKSAKIPAELSALATEYLAVSADAAVDDDMDAAEKASELAASHARRAKDVALTARAEARRRVVRDERTALDKIRKARELLSKTPDDPAANETVGRHEAFRKGRVPEALPFLAKAGHEGLRTAAKRDLEDPAGAAEQAAAGDAWWAVADSLDEASRPAARARAVHWYAKAVEGLAGEARAQAAARLRQGREEQLGPKTAWVAVADPKSFGLGGAAGQPLVVKVGKEHAESALLETRPAGTFDGVSVAVRRDPAGKAHSGLLFGASDRIVYIDMSAPGILVARLKDDKWSNEFSRHIEARDAYSLTVLLVRGEFVVYLDAEELVRLPTERTTVGDIGLFSAWAASTFQDFRLRRAAESK